jgi:hypothetical protein
LSHLRLRLALYGSDFVDDRHGVKQGESVAKQEAGAGMRLGRSFGQRSYADLPPAKNRTRTEIRGLARIALLLLGVLGWQGCDMAEPVTGPVSRTGTASQAPVLHSSHLASFSTDGVLTFLQAPDLSLSRHAGRLIRASEGGSVEVAGFRVEIPAGALAEDTFVTIDLPLSLPQANYVVADFGPSGTRFAKPITLTLPLNGANLAGIDLSTVGVSYWNGSSWEDYGGSATSGAVRTTTDHFSTYGARRGGVETTSGGRGGVETTSGG